MIIKEIRMPSSELGSWITMGKDVVIGLAALSAAVFAYLGLNAWWKELHECGSVLSIG